MTLLFRVKDQSMEPHSREGDFALLDIFSVFLRNFREGDVIVMRDPSDLSRRLLKRIAACRSGKYWVQGDNALWSRDSRIFGWVAKENIIGKVFVVRDKQNRQGAGYVLHPFVDERFWNNSRKGRM